jgi:hypothetical protein
MFEFDFHVGDNFKLFLPNLSYLLAVLELVLEVEQILLYESHKDKQSAVGLYIFTTPLDQLQEKHTTHYLHLLIILLKMLRTKNSL